MLGIKPVYGHGTETLLDWGLVPEEFIPVPGLGVMLAQHDVETTALVREQFTRGPLTRICYRGFSRIFGYTNVESMWSLARHALSHDTAERSVCFIYWGGIDTAIHRHGTANGFWQAEFRSVTRACEEQFLSLLTAEYRTGTLLIMVADHGFVDAPVELAHDADAEPVLRERLLVPFSGESRAAFLHTLDGAAR